MIANRSVPADTVLPHLTYRDVAGAIAWLTNTFGFTEHYRYGDPISGAQMYLGKACIMVRGANPGAASPAETGQRTQSLTVFIDDVDAHYERAKSAGAKIVEEPNETCYGERQYGVEDLDGHRWLFARHARNVSPDEWGATIANAIPQATVESVVALLGVASMEQSLGYYREGLGFGMRNQWVVNGKIRWCWLTLGEAALMLQEFHPARKEEGKVGEGVSLWFQCEDAIALYHGLKTRGIEASEPQVGNNMWDTMLRDPDGYRLHFVSNTDVPEETKLSEVKG